MHKIWSGIGKAAAQAIVDQIERPKSALVELIVKAGAVMPEHRFVALTKMNN